MDPNFGDFWWRQYVALSGPHCAYCLREVPWSKLTRDHIVPRCKGGSDGPENIVPVCRNCNQRKGHLTLRSFVMNGRRCCPGPNAKPHALGELRKGRWVWSDAALRLQAEHQARLRCVSASMHRIPFALRFVYFPLAADIQASLSWAHDYRPIRPVDPEPAPALPGRGPQWWREYLAVAENRCCFCQAETKELVGFRLDTAQGKNVRNTVPACKRCASVRGKSQTLATFLKVRRRVAPAVGSGSHPLGELVANAWVWSDLARQIHAACDDRSPMALAATAAAAA